MKNSITETIVDYFDCDGKSLKEIISYLQEIEAKYPNSYFSYEYNWESTLIEIKYNREETDEEYSTRLQRESNRKKNLKKKKVETIRKITKRIAWIGGIIMFKDERELWYAETEELAKQLENKSYDKLPNPLKD